MKFFYKDLPKNADIARHREREIDLRNKIKEYEDSGDEYLTKVYKQFLNELLASKAEVTSKIGKK